MIAVFILLWFFISVIMLIKNRLHKILLLPALPFLSGVAQIKQGNMTIGVIIIVLWALVWIIPAFALLCEYAATRLI